MYNTDDVFEDLRSMAGEGFEAGSVERDVPLKKYTTFRIGGPADIMFTAVNAAMMSEVMTYLNGEGVPYFILGKGSNLLVKDRGYRGVVLRMAGALAKVTADADTGTVSAGAGASMSSLANAAAEASLTGLEFASGIPGSIGGGVFMNAGAYDGEMSQVIRSAQVMMPDGSIRRLNRDELDLSYRHSVLMDNGGVVLSAEFGLEPGVRDEIIDKMKDLNGRRRDKQPLEYPSAGSTFKRPEGHFAGKLIQDSGCMDLAVGGAKVSPKHAGFIINYDNATAKDVLELIELVKLRVLDMYGVELEPEVRVIGE